MKKFRYLYLIFLFLPQTPCGPSVSREFPMPFKCFRKIHQRLTTSECEILPKHLPASVNTSAMVTGFCLHATLPLGVRPPKFGLVEAVDTLGTVLLYQTASAASTAPGADSARCVPAQYPPLSEPVASSPPLPPDVFLRGNPLSPSLIRDVIVIICHICNKTQRGWAQELQ